MVQQFGLNWWRFDSTPSPPCHREPLSFDRKKLRSNAQHADILTCHFINTGHVLLGFQGIWIIADGRLVGLFILLVQTSLRGQGYYVIAHCLTPIWLWKLFNRLSNRRWFLFNCPQCSKLIQFCKYWPWLDKLAYCWLSEFTRSLFVLAWITKQSFNSTITVFSFSWHSEWPLA